MNKDKLISLIIRKETYKDTKPFLNDLAAGKEYFKSQLEVQLKSQRKLSETSSPLIISSKLNFMLSEYSASYTVP